MKSKILILIAAGILILYIPSCKASASKEDRNKQETPAKEDTFSVKEMTAPETSIQIRPEVSIPNSPEWVNIIPPDEAVYGIGTAKMSNLSMSMTTAEARARTAIFRYINETAQAAIRDYFTGSGDSSGPAASAYMESAAVKISGMEISGALPVNRWQAADSTWWYLAEYKKSELKTALTIIFESMQNDFPQYDYRDILKCLDNALAVNNRPVIWDN